VHVKLLRELKSPTAGKLFKMFMTWSQKKAGLTHVDFFLNILYLWPLLSESRGGKGEKVYPGFTTFGGPAIAHKIFLLCSTHSHTFIGFLQPKSNNTTLSMSEHFVFL